MPTQSVIIARIETAVQGRGIDPHQSPLVDGAAMTAESILPNALRYAVRQMLAQGENILNVSKNHTIALAAGVGTLPVTVLPEYLRRHSHLPAVTFASYLDYPDYTKAKFTSLLKYYSANAGSFYYSDSAAASVVLNAPTVPALPSDPDTDSGLSEKLADHLITVACAVLTGELSFRELTDE